jgi:hypothetical protein
MELLSLDSYTCSLHLQVCGDDGRCVCANDNFITHYGNGPVNPCNNLVCRCKYNNYQVQLKNNKYFTYHGFEFANNLTLFETNRFNGLIFLFII